MKVIVKIIGTLIGAILYPFFWLLEWFLCLLCVIFEEIEKIMEEDI